jgi:ketosteroid isomerase-like protein
MSNSAANTLPAPLARLHAAWNTRDLDALAACLHPDYESIHPLHPERNFWGREAATLSWAAVFGAVPDLKAELLRWSVCGDEVWTEWRWSGVHSAGPTFNAGGVMVFGLDGERIAWARVYTEIVPCTCPDWDAVLADILDQAEA